MNYKLKDDLREVNRRFPQLKYISENGTFSLEYLKGDIDIFDTNGNYWDTFTIKIIIPYNYPFGVPTLFELSKKIKRCDARHISSKGECCVNSAQELLIKAHDGLKIKDFIKWQVYPYLCNQLYFEKKKKFAGEEYQHFEEGIMQYYFEKLNVNDPIIVIKIIEFLLSNNKPRNKDICPCGSGKISKRCHFKTLSELRKIGNRRLQIDLNIFKKGLNFLSDTSRRG